MSKDRGRGLGMELERAPQARTAMVQQLLQMDKKEKQRWLRANAAFRRRVRLPDR